MSYYFDWSNIQFITLFQTVVILSIILILFHAVKDAIRSKSGFFKKFIGFMCSSCLVVAICALFGFNLLEQNIILIHTLGLIMYGAIASFYAAQYKQQQLAD